MKQSADLSVNLVKRMPYKCYKMFAEDYQDKRIIFSREEIVVVIVIVIVCKEWRKHGFLFKI